VREGEELARKHRLSAPIIEVIRQHHGTTVARPFFHKARQAAAEAAAVVRPFNAGQPDSTVLLPREDDFRYHGPKPSFRESAIISLADAIEGATRSLRDTTAESIRAKVNEIVNQRFQDGQLDECDLTIREIRVIAERFTRTLLSMMRTRVAYPKDEPKDAPANQPDQQAAPPAGQQSKLA
jgi:membrane-associated HD superfamily phosphohydrolase